MSMFRKLTAEEAATTEFTEKVASKSAEVVDELVQAFKELAKGDAVAVDMNGTGTTMRAMKRRVTEAAKQVGLAVTYANSENTTELPDQLIFRLRAPRAKRTPKAVA